MQKSIALSAVESTTGLILSRLEHEAQIVFRERQQASAVFVAFLRETHDAPESAYDLDWIKGFIEKAATPEDKA